MQSMFVKNPTGGNAVPTPSPSHIPSNGAGIAPQVDSHHRELNSCTGYWSNESSDGSDNFDGDDDENHIMPSETGD